MSNWSDDTYERERDYELAKYERPDAPHDPAPDKPTQDRAEAREAA